MVEVVKRLEIIEGAARLSLLG